MQLNRGEYTVLTVSDMQIPYEHKDALDFVEELYDVVQPDFMVCMGDEVDQYGLSRYDPDPDADAAGPELRTARRHLDKWFETFPEMLVCESNHTARVYKRALQAGIPEAYMRTVKEWLGAPEGWTWDESFEIDGVKYEHGDAQGGMYAARNLAVRNRKSTVIGHHHSHGGVLYVANDDEMIFGMNTGCLIDHNSVAFRYARHAAHKPTLGTGVVIKGVPYFVPMLTKKSGRWTGEIIL